MRRLSLLLGTSALVAFAIAVAPGCSTEAASDDDPSTRPDKKDKDDGTSDTNPAAEPGEPQGTPPGGGVPLPADVPKTGILDLVVNADKGAATNVVISFGFPFPQGVLTDGKAISLKNAAGDAVPTTLTVLAKWPMDGSVRSVLVAFKATLASGKKETWKVEYGAAPGPEATGLAANPDGPATALLPADWYGKSRASGILLPIAQNKALADYDTELADAWTEFDVNTFKVNCPTTADHRTYYDGVHAQYQRFLRSSDPVHYRSARNEAKWYRANEMTYYDGKKTAVHVCQPAGWTPTEGLKWDVIRRMASQGNLDDFLLTGDVAAKDAVFALGEGYRKSLPALVLADPDPSIEGTERNLGWTIMGMASYYALDTKAEVKDALVSLVQRAVDWQAKGTSGAFEHDVAAADDEECGDGPKGASPFMTSLVVDGLMDYWFLTGDSARVEPVVKKLAVWFETKAITPDKKAFQYLWNCLDTDYPDSDYTDLNLLIVHTFGAAYVLTKDTHWLDFGDSIAETGIADMYATRPKQWNQAARSFGKYLGYRALGKTP